MEVMGVFSSCVTALMKLPCCSFRRISRTRKVVFKIMPRMIVAKTITPRNNMTLWRQLRMIQPTSSAIAKATRDMPSTRKKAIVFRRLAIRIGFSESQLNCTPEAGSCAVRCELQGSVVNAQRKRQDAAIPRSPVQQLRENFKRKCLELCGYQFGL